jgi:hypothetical protein
MRDDAHESELEGEAIDNAEEGVDADDEVDEAGEEFLGDYGVFFDELREVVESGSYKPIIY